ncbi:MAG: anion transporter [Nitrospinae bacterium]|nr:anion transporter [Nitrospinota bacterium]
MDPAFASLLIFAATYFGIALGTFPGLALDRTGVALLGAIAMVVAGALSTDEAVRAIDTSTILLLYGLMVLSAQFRLWGFYTHVALGILRFMEKPRKFLAILMGVSALFSAVLANDIVCLAFTPVLAVSLVRARLNPLPFLIGLTCASNIGSAATIIGNPQNMLIGQIGGLDFGKFTLWCAPPSLLSLAAAYGIILAMYSGNWDAPYTTYSEVHAEWPPYNRYQSAKGLVLTMLLMALFLTSVPREFTALCVAAILMCSRKTATRSILGLVDWHLISFFCALFIVMEGVIKYGLPQQGILWMASNGLDINAPLALSGVSLVLSNIVSNVPAVLLLLKNMDLTATDNLYLLSLVSTFAGNLITIGSIANLITIEQAKAHGINIGFMEHARTGVPVAAASCLIAIGWFFVVHVR